MLQDSLAHGMPIPDQERLRLWLLTPEGQLLYRWLEHEQMAYQESEHLASTWEKVLFCRGRVEAIMRLFTFFKQVTEHAV